MKRLIVNTFRLLVFFIAVPVYSSQLHQLDFEVEATSAISEIFDVSKTIDTEIPREIEKNVNPVIITVAGLNFGELGWGAFELKNLKKLLSIVFHKKSVNIDSLEDEFYKEYAEYFEGEYSLFPPSMYRLPDNYLEQKIKELSFYNSDIIIIPFSWSRDPDDTEKVIPVFENKLKEVYKNYGDKRPIFIIAHSWGSVLMHETLNRLSKDAPEVKIDKMITMASPLVPSNFFVKLFMKLEISTQDLLKYVEHPKNLKYWVNIWAERDISSNSIPVADQNIQIDEDVEKLEPKLLDIILHNKELRPIAKKDLLKLRDIRAWHISYILDYKTYLESLNKTIEVKVFMPVIAPQLIKAK